MIDQETFSDFLEFAIILLGPLVDWALVAVAAGVVGAIVLVLALGMLRRMRNP